MQCKYQVQDPSPGAETSNDYLYRLGSERLVGAQKIHRVGYVTVTVAVSMGLS